MPRLDQPTSDVAAGIAFDDLIQQNAAMPSLEERAVALDFELTRIEGGFRAALAIADWTAAAYNRAAQARRIICLRRLLDLVWFLDKHKADPVLRKRLAELREEDAGGSRLD